MTLFSYRLASLTDSSSTNLRCLQQKHPELNIAGTLNPPSTTSHSLAELKIHYL